MYKIFYLVFGWLLTVAVVEAREYPLDSEISPCADFYQHVCKQVAKDFKLPRGRTHYSFAASDLKEEILKQKKTYLLQLAKNTPKDPKEQMLKNYFLAQLDFEGQRQEEVAEIVRIKRWLSAFNDKTKLLTQCSNNVFKCGEFSFIKVWLNLHSLDRPSVYDVAFDLSSLMNLPETSYYQNEQLVEDYTKLITLFFKQLGSKNPGKQAKIVVAFEQALAKVYPVMEVVRERFSEPHTINQDALLKGYPNLGWTNILRFLPKEVIVRDVVGMAPFDWLESHLAYTTLDELKTLILYYQLFNLLDQSLPKFQQAKFKFVHRYLGGAKLRSHRLERATLATLGALPMELDALLLPKLFPTFDKKPVERLVKRIQTSLLDQLRANRWLSAEARERAIEKISKLQWFLVAPESEKAWGFNPVLVYHPHTPIANAKKLSQALMERALLRLHKGADHEEWLMGPLTVNAYYEPAFNRIVFPIGILQPPFYDPNLPEAINLGAIGTIIGHEMGHAIDDQGNRFNAQGILENWMSPQDQQEFKRRTAKLIVLFDQAGHNGKYTLGENIGDLVGLTTAYRVLQEDQPNLEVIRNFFVQYGRSWCGVDEPGFRQLRLKVDPHALGEARVNQQVRLQPGFKKAYDCCKGDAMVGEEEIAVW